MSHHPRQRKLSARPLMAVVVACLLAVLVAAPASAVDITTTGNGSWQVPAGVTSIAIECWGGGGGGGGDNNSTLTGGGGGGGGAYAKVNAFAVTPGQNLNYFVGAGGSASINGGNGGAGGNTTFNGNTCVAVGGSGGIDGSSTGAGGNGGTAAASTGNIKYDGGKGAPGGGSGNNAYGGGGGGSAGTGSNGNIGNGMNGAGAVADGGAGGDGALSDNGSNAPAPGPGGGGGGGEYFPTGGSRTRNGGMGYAGKIRIRYNATLSVANTPVTYNGSAQAATLSASVGATAVAGVFDNIKYDGSSTVPTSAGTYAITADFTPTVTSTYNTLFGVSAGNFVINKATPTLAVTNSPVTYNGAAQDATLAASRGLATVPGSFTNVKYNNLSTVPMDAGTYAVTADFTPTDGTNYNSVTGAAGNFIVNKATPTLAVTNSGVTYNSAPQDATLAALRGVATVAGSFTNVKYNNLSTVPTDAGTYAVTADFAPGDATNYNSLTDASAGNFVIGKATTATAVTCGVGSFPYTGAAQTPCSASVTGDGGLSDSVAVDYADNIDAGTASASASYAGTTNYQSSSDSKNFTIAKATSTTTVTCDSGPFVYKNLPFNPCSATLTGAGGLTGNPEVSYSNNVDAGTATASAGYPGDANHEASSDSKNFTIDKATPVLSVETPSVTYTGSAQQANVVGSAAVVGPVDGTASNVKYNGSDTAPADAGTYPITADFTPVDVANYNSVTGAAAGVFTIGKASSTTAITCGVGSFLYTGSAQEPCSASVTGVGGFTEVLTVVYTDNTNAGTAGAGASFAGNTNFAASSNSTTFTIDKAASTTTVTCDPGPFVYKNLPFTPCSASLTGAGGLTGNPEVSYSSNVNAGTATASASYPGDANHEASNDSKNFAIDKATPVLSVENPSVTYTGLAQQATVVGSAAVVGPVDGAASNVKYNGSDTAPADAGTYPITADFAPVDAANYNSVTGAAAGDFVIDKAATVTAVTCGAGPFVYQNVPFTPCTAIVTGPPNLNEALTVTYANNTAAGTASASASYAGDANHQSSNGAATFTIDKATPTLSVENPSVTYNGLQQLASVIGSVAGRLAASSMTGSTPRRRTPGPMRSRPISPRRT